MANMLSEVFIRTVEEAEAEALFRRQMGIDPEPQPVPPGPGPKPVPPGPGPEPEPEPEPEPYPIPPQDPTPAPESISDLDTAIQARAREVFGDDVTLESLAAVTDIKEFLGDPKTITATRLDLRAFPNVTELNDGQMFMDNTSLQSVNLGNVTTVTKGMFQRTKITELYGDSLTTLDYDGPSMLRATTELETVSLPNLEGSTEYFAFANIYSKVKSVSLPKYVQYTDYMFAHSMQGEGLVNNTLEEVYLPKVKFAGKYMFQNCTALATVYMPEVTTIGPAAFTGCTGLGDIHLESVTEIVNHGDSPKSRAMTPDTNFPFINCDTDKLRIFLGEQPPVVSLETSTLSDDDGVATMSDDEDGIALMADNAIYTVVVPSEAALALYEADEYWGNTSKFILQVAEA